MTKKRQLYIENEISEFILDFFNEIEFKTLKEDKEQSLFHFGGEGANLYFSNVDWEVLKSCPIGFINEKILKYDIPKLIVKRFLAGEGKLAVEENYKGVLQKINTLKISDSKNLGYFSDVMASFAMSANVNPTEIRNFSVQLLSYLEYLNRSEITKFPFELDFGISNDCFFFQLHCDNSDFYLENILESSHNVQKNNPFSSLLNEVIGKLDLIEFYTIDNSSKLVISGCWIYHDEFSNTYNHSSLLIHQVNSLRSPIENNGYDIVPRTFFEDELQEHKKQKTLESLPTRFVSEGQPKKRINPMLVKRLYEFLVSKNKKIGDINYEDYEIENLEKDIVDYPDKKALSRLRSSEKEELLSMLKGQNLEILGVAESLKSQIEPDEYLDGMLSSFDEMSSESVAYSVNTTYSDNTLVKGKVDFDEDVALIRGEKEEQNEEKFLVKGEGTEKENDFIKIKGIGSENWSSTKTEIIDKAKEIIKDFKDKMDPRLEVDFGMKTILASKLDLPEDVCEKLVNDLSDTTTDNWVNEGMEAAELSILQRLKLEKAENKLSLREKQVEKMGVLIEALKKDLASAREELGKGNSTLPTNSDGFSMEIDFDELEQNSSMSKDQVLKYLKSSILDQEREYQRILNANKKFQDENKLLYKRLEERGEKIEDLKNQDSNFSNLQQENANLKNQLEGLKSRMEILYEKNKKDTESSVNINEVSKIIEDKERFFEEKMKLSKEVDQLKAILREAERSIKQRELEVKQVNDLVKGKTGIVEKEKFLELERKLEDYKKIGKRFEADLKSSQLMVKAYEQKLKFLNAQLEQSNKDDKKKKRTNLQSGTSDPKSSAKIKHVENMNKRLKEAGEKVQKDLQEKKTELHKVKMENKTLELKLKELQKKLLSLEGKKSA